MFNLMIPVGTMKIKGNIGSGSSSISTTFVNTFADIATTITSPTQGQQAYVRKASGIRFTTNRKEAGFYMFDGTNWVTIDRYMRDIEIQAKQIQQLRTVITNKTNSKENHDLTIGTEHILIIGSNGTSTDDIKLPTTVNDGDSLVLTFSSWDHSDVNWKLKGKIKGSTDATLDHANYNQRSIILTYTASSASWDYVDITNMNDFARLGGVATEYNTLQKIVNYIRGLTAPTKTEYKVHASSIVVGNNNDTSVLILQNKRNAYSHDLYYLAEKNIATNKDIVVDSLDASFADNKKITLEYLIYIDHSIINEASLKADGSELYLGLSGATKLTFKVQYDRYNGADLSLSFSHIVSKKYNSEFIVRFNVQLTIPNDANAYGYDAVDLVRTGTNSLTIEPKHNFGITIRQFKGNVKTTHLSLYADDIVSLVPVDDTLSDTSENPLENKAIYAELAKKADVNSAGAVSSVIFYDGDWSNRPDSLKAANLKKGQVVFRDKVYFVCATDGATTEPDNSKSDWEILANRVEKFDSSTEYYIGDVVENKGKLYKAKKTNNVEPTNSQGPTNWDTLLDVKADAFKEIHFVVGNTSYKNPSSNANAWANVLGLDKTIEDDTNGDIAVTTSGKITFKTKGNFLVSFSTACNISSSTDTKISFDLAPLKSDGTVDTSLAHVHPETITQFNFNGEENFEVVWRVEVKHDNQDFQLRFAKDKNGSMTIKQL